MPVRIVEWQLPYTAGTGIEIDSNKVISLLLREENNLIMVNDDNEVYTDLQLETWIRPSDTFPVWVTVGKILQADGWTQSWLLLNWKTTSGDYARWIYANDGNIYFDGGTWTRKQVYYSSQVDAAISQLRDEVYEYFIRYQDYYWVTKTGSSFELSLSSEITPEEDFTVNAPTDVETWQAYVLRVTNGTTAYTMTLGNYITNPKNVDTTLNPNTVDTFVFLAVDGTNLELQPIIDQAASVNNWTLTIQQNWTTAWTFTANQATNTTVNITTPTVVDDLTTQSSTNALSANQWYLLKGMIDDLSGFGKFLSLRDATTWQPISFPLATPYTYSTWDYFVVETISSATPPVNYRPSGSSYTWTASSTTESDELEVWDVYVYDGTVWLLQSNHWKTVAFANIAWQPTDNANLATALNAKQDTLTAWSWIDITSNVIKTTFNYWESTSAATDTTKTVSIPAITSLNAGQLIVVKTTTTNTAWDTSLQLNSFTAYPIRYMGAALTSTTDSYIWTTWNYTTFLFDWTYRQAVAKTNDLNTTYTLNYSVDAWKYTAGTWTYAITRYSVVMQKANGTWEKITDPTANYTTWTTKTVNTNGFILNEIRYYNTTTTLATGVSAWTNVFSEKAAEVDMRYSTNCWATTWWTEWGYLYLVWTIWADGLFYLDTTTWRTTTLPTTNDGKLYIRMGLVLATDGYKISFYSDRPIFYYNNGLKIYVQADNKQDNLSAWSWISISSNTVSNTWVTSLNSQTWAVTLKTINGTALDGSWDITISAPTYNAWPWIEIWDNYLAMQWPAPTWYHVPTKSEWSAIYTALVTDFGLSANSSTMKTYLKMPLAGFRDYSSASAIDQSSYAVYWSSTASSAGEAYYLFFSSSTLDTQNSSNRSNGASVRCFKNTPVTPDSTWTQLTTPLPYDMWVFHNSTLSLISIVYTWWIITISDKNLWATVVYNDGDTLAQTNCWYYYQRWNDNGFDWTGTITTSSTQVDASSYWPSSHYSDSTFIYGSTDWSSVQNDNLWGWVTWINAITNTWILNDTTWTTTTVTKIRAWTEAEYALITPDANTIYHVY